MNVSDLPVVNATLNGTATALLAAGYFFIRRGQIARHRACMLGAFAVSTGFLASYLYYHYHHGATPFPGTGWARPAYFTLLVSHVTLAALVVPFVLVALHRALTNQFERHRRVARIAYPIWMYVSVTGVVVYWVLYHLYAA